MFECINCGCSMDVGGELCYDCSHDDDTPDYYDDREDERDGFRDDVEADADTLASAGYGTDEDYGCYGGYEESGDYWEDG